MRKSKRDFSPYKSGFEMDVAAFYGKQVEYEPTVIPFVQPEVKRKYLPDFRIKENVFIETKGKLALEDRKKHLWIKEQHPEITIIFLFQNSQNKLTRRSNTTYGDWCDANQIPWFCWRTNPPPKTIKELLLSISRNLSRQNAEPSTLKASSRKKK